MILSRNLPKMFTFNDIEQKSSFFFVLVYISQLLAWYYGALFIWVLSGISCKGGPLQLIPVIFMRNFLRSSSS